MLTELSALLDLLRAKGVTRFEGALVLPEDPTTRIVVDFGPLDAPAKPDEKDDSPITDVETCRCGHALYAHINGLCGEGCDVTLCAPPEKP